MGPDGGCRSGKNRLKCCILVAFCCIFVVIVKFGVSLTGLVREVGGRLADVELAGDDVGDEARAVLAEELDLAAGAGDGGVEVAVVLSNVLHDLGLVPAC